MERININGLALLLVLVVSAATTANDISDKSIFSFKKNSPDTSQHSIHVGVDAISILEEGVNPFLTPGQSDELMARWEKLRSEREALQKENLLLAARMETTLTTKSIGKISELEYCKIERSAINEVFERFSVDLKDKDDLIERAHFEKMASFLPFSEQSDAIAKELTEKQKELTMIRMKQHALKKRFEIKIKLKDTQIDTKKKHIEELRAQITSKKESLAKLKAKKQIEKEKRDEIIQQKKFKLSLFSNDHAVIKHKIEVDIRNVHEKKAILRKRLSKVYDIKLAAEKKLEVFKGQVVDHSLKAVEFNPVTESLFKEHPIKKTVQEKKKNIFTKIKKNKKKKSHGLFDVAENHSKTHGLFDKINTNENKKITNRLFEHNKEAIAKKKIKHIRKSLFDTVKKDIKQDKKKQETESVETKNSLGGLFSKHTHKDLFSNQKNEKNENNDKKVNTLGSLFSKKDQSTHHNQLGGLFSHATDTMHKVHGNVKHDTDSTTTHRPNSLGSLFHHSSSDTNDSHVKNGLGSLFSHGVEKKVESNGGHSLGSLFHHSSGSNTHGLGSLFGHNHNTHDLSNVRSSGVANGRQKARVHTITETVVKTYTIPGTTTIVYFLNGKEITKEEYDRLMAEGSVTVEHEDGPIPADFTVTTPAAQTTITPEEDVTYVVDGKEMSKAEFEEFQKKNAGIVYTDAGSGKKKLLAQRAHSEDLTLEDTVNGI